jgi:2,3-bisphosphoglycerate-dependent phosphoglycerate mutase
MPELLLIRHCEATGQEPDAPLSLEGEEQASELADRLAAEPIDHVVASPYLRAQRSAHPLAARLGLSVHSDARLVEHRLASPPIAEWRSFVARAFTEPHVRAPGGDPPAATLTRGLAALESVLALDRALPVLVTHGLLLSLLLQSIDESFGFEDWASLRCPDVFRLSGPIDRMRFERIELS